MLQTPFLRQYLNSHPSGKARLVASVRFPTNLQELANLEDDYPGTVLLHTGFQFPVEGGGHRGQFHAKDRSENKRQSIRHTPCGPLKTIKKY